MDADLAGWRIMRDCDSGKSALHGERQQIFYSVMLRRLQRDVAQAQGVGNDRDRAQ